MLTDDSLRVIGVPEELWQELKDYVNGHIRPTSSFLVAVLNNDLRLACMEAITHDRRASLHNIVVWLYNHAPAECWGFTQAVEGWCSRK